MSDAHLTIYRAVKLNRVIQYLRSIAEVRQKTNDHFQYIDSDHLPAREWFRRWMFDLRFATARRVGACHAEAFGLRGFGVCFNILTSNVQPSPRLRLGKLSSAI
jgi:hypothetical protein